jgi:hypothetical protein
MSLKQCNFSANCSQMFCTHHIPHHEHPDCNTTECTHRKDFCITTCRTLSEEEELLLSY